MLSSQNIGGKKKRTEIVRKRVKSPKRKGKLFSEQTYKKKKEKKREFTVGERISVQNTKKLHYRPEKEKSEL